MAGKIEQAVDLRDGELLRPVSDFDDLIPCADFSFLNHAEIKAGALVRDQEGSHLRIIHSDPDSIAGNSRLGHLEKRRADPITVPDADHVIGKTVDREVFSELAVFKTFPLQLRLPVSVRVELIHHHCAMFPAMTRKVTLSVTIEIKTARHHPARYGFLPYGRAHDFALPLDIAWQADIY